MEQIRVTGRMPVLALRGLAVFPDQTIHFDVGRPKSIKALEDAMKKDQQIFLVPQRDIVNSDPGINDLYTIGTVAKVKQVLKTHGDNLRVLVTGLCRARIEDLDAAEPKNMNSEAYEEWGDLHEELEDLVDDVLDRLDEMT